MTDNVEHLYDPESGVVKFGVRPAGYTAIVDGYEVNRIRVWERGDQITICLDSRFAIDVPRGLSGAVCWMIANAIAIGSGYSHLGADRPGYPFAPKVVGGDGKPDITGGGAQPISPSPDTTI